MPVAARRRTVAALLAGLRKRAAGPAPARIHRLEEEHRPAAAVIVHRRPVEHCIAVERRPVRLHKLVARRRPAAVRPVLLSKGPAEGRRARLGLDRLVLLLP
jgi:hypothetical protein